MTRRPHRQAPPPPPSGPPTSFSTTTTSTSLQEDEALARELQRQFAAEFRESQQQQVQQTQQRPVKKGQAASVRRRPSGSKPSTVPVAAAAASIPVESDEQYARRLERAFREEEEKARGLTSSSSHQRGVATDPDGRAPHSGSSYSTHPSNPYDASHYPDDEGDWPRDVSAAAPPPSLESIERALQHEELGSSSCHSRKPPRSGLSTLSSHSSHHNNRAPNSGSTHTSSFAESDEEFARRLQREMRREEEQAAAAARAAAASSGRTSTSRHHAGGPTSSLLGVRSLKHGGGTVTPITSESDDVSAVSDMTNDDVELARRVEQELRDEELAQRLAKDDRDRASERRARQLQSTAAPAPSPGCSVRRTCSYLIPALVLCGAVVGVTLYFTRGATLPDFFPSPEDFRNEDPFTAKNASEVEKWRTNGNVGLEMELIAALESNWLPYFDKAVQEWDAGTPDALTLSKSYSNHEVDCEPVNFKIKVCNGDYGDTKWRGINKILLTDGYIFASTAKMNEYYFTGTSDTDAQRQYTMCHEIGHGFGLPHSDESFTNADLGNCMDYTNHPEVNMQPDKSNFIFLEELYGDVPSSNTGGSTSTNANAGSGGRQRRQQRRVRRLDAIPDWVMERWRSIEVEFGHHAHGAEHGAAGWRLLHQSPYGEAHEVDLGDGYSIQVHKLYQ